MSGYYERIQGRDRLLRIRRMRQIVFVVLVGLTALLLFIRLANSGASLRPLFLPLAGVLEVGLIMGLVGTGIGLYFKNLEIQRTVRESQKFLLARHSMSRAATTAAICILLGILLFLPFTAVAMESFVTEPPRFVSLSAAGQGTDSQAFNFTSPDAFGVSYVRTIHIEMTSGAVNVSILRDDQPWASRSLSGNVVTDLAVQPLGSAFLTNWSVKFQNMAGTPAALTFTLPVGIMPELFGTVPFLLILYAAASLGWWAGLRPIRERTRAAAVYAGKITETDRGERMFMEYAVPQESAQTPSVASPSLPPPPPPEVPPIPAAAPATVAMPPPDAGILVPPPAPPTWPETPDRLLSKGDALVGAGQFAASLVAYDEALRLDPTYRPAMLSKAAALLSLNRDIDALAVYHRVLAVDPEDETALRASAKILAGQARWREALDAVDTYLKKKPNDSVCLELKGDVLASLGRRPESLAAYEAALAMDPSNANVKQKIEEVRVDVPGLLSRALICSANGNYAQALNLFDEILEVEPSNVNALIGKAVAYRRSGKSQEALNCLDLVLNIQPANAAALLNRGHLLVERGDLPAALEAFGQLVSISPSDEEGWIALADAQHAVGRNEDALRSLREASRLSPGDEEILRKIRELEPPHAAPTDILEGLYTVKGVGPARAKALLDAGYRTAEDLRKATVEQLLEVHGITRRIAEDLVKHFKDVSLVEAR